MTALKKKTQKSMSRKRKGYCSTCMNWSRDVDKSGVGYCCGGDTFAINRQYNFPVITTTKAERAKARIEHLQKKWEEA